MSISAMFICAYGTDEANIRKNLSRNSDRFEEGKHYYLLTGSKLKEFKRLVTTSHLVSKYTSQVILWAERGAARMSKRGNRRIRKKSYAKLTVFS